jgi:hypothetical protein
MKTRSYTHLALVVVGVLVLTVTLSVIFSRAQQDTAATLLQNSVFAVTEEQIATLAEARLQAFFTNRIPHTACANCFQVGDGRYGIYEEVPGTGKVLSRDLPDPAPLGPGEVCPDRDSETGEPIWYQGKQGFVGPTDEEPLSASLPIPKIELSVSRRDTKTNFSESKGFMVLALVNTAWLCSLPLSKVRIESRFQPLLKGSLSLSKNLRCFNRRLMELISTGPCPSVQTL